MKKRAFVVMLVLALVGVSVGTNGEWLRLTTGISAAYTLWQTSPRRFASETYWGGLGVEILYRSISFGAAVTLADLETFRIREDPSFSLGASLAFLRFGDAGLRVSVGTVLHPSNDWVAVSASVSAFWDALPFTTLRTWIGYETVLAGASGSCIFVGVGTSLYLPLL